MAPRYKDITGLKFGKRTVLEEAGRSKGGTVLWLCRCECGSEDVVSGTKLQCGLQQQCPECSKKSIKKRKRALRLKWFPGYQTTVRRSLIGRKFGHLLVRSQGPNSEPTKSARIGNTQWWCECKDCGKGVLISGSSLVTGNTTRCRDCGWASSGAKNTTHGMSKRPEYGVWSGLIQRCTNENRDCYDDYGGRGIEVSNRWLPSAGGSFENFYADLGPRPSKKHQIDRGDNDGPYSEENCGWVPIKKNQQNKRSNHLFTDPFTGEKLCQSAIARRYGLKLSTFRGRINNGWSMHKTITTPLDPEVSARCRRAWESRAAKAHEIKETK